MDEVKPTFGRTKLGAKENVVAAPGTTILGDVALPSAAS